MKICGSTFTVIAVAFAAMACAALAPGAQAQAVAPAVSAAPASAPAVDKSMPRPMTAAEKRDSATVPGDVRPEEPVIPQISVPLGRTPPAPAQTKADLERKRQAAAKGGVEDSIARCKAVPTKSEREDCLSRQQRVGSAPRP
jgi:hypothetical protein